MATADGHIDCGALDAVNPPTMALTSLGCYARFMWPAAFQKTWVTWRPNSGEITQTSNRSRNVVPDRACARAAWNGCTGNCKVFKATFRGREGIYPSPYGELTAGGNKGYPVDYFHFNIQGYALAARRSRSSTASTS